MDMCNIWYYRSYGILPVFPSLFELEYTFTGRAEIQHYFSNTNSP